VGIVSVIEALLADTFGVPVEAVKAMDRHGFIDRRAVVRHMIINDPCTDYKVVRSRYSDSIFRVSINFVYECWRLRFSCGQNGMTPK
jgi:hypothetical protein